MADLAIKQGDLEPGIFATLLDSSGTPVVLGIDVESVQLRFADQRRVELWVRDATIRDIDGGAVSYAWQTGDTDAPGLYYAEFVVTWTTARPQTYPPSGYLVIIIEPKL